MTPELRQSYSACCRMARQAASSFYPAFWWLPRAKFRSMCALYAFLRRTDDLSDSAAPLEERREKLAEWRALLQQAVAGQPVVAAAPNEYTAIFPALIDTLETYRMPQAYFFAAIDGAEMDLRDVVFPTFADLERYCYCVAGVVGLACIHIWGFRQRAALAPAIACGTAFQLTNVLRDLREDAERGRVYLPLEDLARFGVSPGDLLNPAQEAKLAPLLHFELARAETYYAEAARLPEYLERDGRRVYALMWNRYHALLEKIRHTGAGVLRGRVRLGWGDKFVIVAATLLGREPRPASESAVVPASLARSQHLAE